MSVGRCWHHADRIGRLPLSEWAAEVKAIPLGCEHDDCGPPKCCRTRIAEYMRVQFAAARALARTAQRKRTEGRK